MRPDPRVAPLPTEAIGICTSPPATSRARNEGGFPLSHPTFFMGPTTTEGPLRPSPRPALAQRLQPWLLTAKVVSERCKLHSSRVSCPQADEIPRALTA